MGRTIAKALTGLAGAASLCCLCSEPGPGASLSSWVMWETAWAAVLAASAYVLGLIEDKEAKDHGTE